MPTIVTSNPSENSLRKTKGKYYVITKNPCDAKSNNNSPKMKLSWYNIWKERILLQVKYAEGQTIKSRSELKFRLRVTLTSFEILMKQGYSVKKGATNNSLLYGLKQVLFPQTLFLVASQSIKHPQRRLAEKIIGARTVWQRGVRASGRNGEYKQLWSWSCQRRQVLEIANTLESVTITCLLAAALRRCTRRAALKERWEPAVCPTIAQKDEQVAAAQRELFSGIFSAAREKCFNAWKFPSNMRNSDHDCAILPTKTLKRFWDDLGYIRGIIACMWPEKQFYTDPVLQAFPINSKDITYLPLCATRKFK